MNPTRAREPRRLLRRAIAAVAVWLGATLAIASAAHAQQLLTVGPNPTGIGRGRVISFPAGIDCTMMDGPTTTGTCSRSFTTGTVVTLVAQPANADVSFTGYSGASVAACGGGGVDCVLTMSQSRSVTAQFTPNKSYLLTFTVSGNGYGVVAQRDFRGTPPIGCSIQGTNTTVVCTASYPATTIAKLELTAGIAFASMGQFGGACAGMAFCTLNMDGPVSASATFRSPAIVIPPSAGSGSGRITSSIGGLNCTTSGSSATGTCFATFPSPSQQNVTLSATANAGSKFSGWTVSDRSCAGTGTCLVSGPAFYTPGTVVTARFDTDQNTITVSGTGSGTIKSVPSGIDCTLTVNNPGTGCDAPFTPGASVTLTATPATGWQFASWGGACSGANPTCQLEMTQNRAVSVTFSRIPVALTILAGATGNGVGQVKSDPAGIVCEVSGTNTTGTCTFQFPFDTPVTLTATPNATNTFESWSGPCTGTDPCKVSMSVARTITVTFRGSLVPVTVGGGVSTGNGIVKAANGFSCRITKGVAATTGCVVSATLGTTVTLTADPQDGSVFTDWSLASCPATSLTCDVSVAQATSVNARFTAPPAAAQLVDALLLGTALPATQRTELDRFGNKDGTFNLGDLLALFDRTNESISPAALARLIEAERTKTNRGLPAQRTP